jgi:hypothetical protein
MPESAYLGIALRSHVSKIMLRFRLIDSISTQERDIE